MDADRTGRMSGERIAEVREQAEYASVTVDADELLWLLDEVEGVAGILTRVEAERDAAKAEVERVRALAEDAGGKYAHRNAAPLISPADTIRALDGEATDD